MNQIIAIAVVLVAALLAGTFSATPLAFADESETNAEQKLKQENVGSGESTNFNCGENNIDETVPNLLCGTIDLSPPSNEFRFELSNCFSITGFLTCDAEQISPLPPTYDEIFCSFASQGPQPDSCSLGRIDGGDNDPATCTINFRDFTAVCVLETDA